MINMSDTSISDMYVGTSQVSAAFLGTDQVYPNAPLPPIMGTFSAQSDTTATPEPYDDTNSVYLTVTTDNGNFTVTDAQNNTSIFMNYTGGQLSPVTSITRMRLTPSSCLNMFGELKYVTSINTSGLNTSNARDMSNMFNLCQSLTSLNVSNFDTSNVTSMQQMFFDCRSLTSIAVSNFNTANVTNMNYMFYGCQSLTSLDLSDFDYSSAYMFEGMFEGCTSLATLNISNIVMSAGYTTDMFAGVPSTCVITMNNVDNNTFDVLTHYTTTGLNTGIVIMRDGVRYAYDSTRDEWVQQQARYELLDEIHATQMNTYIDTLYTCTIDTRIEVRYVCNGQYQSDHPRLFSTGSTWGGSDTIAIDYEGNVNMYVKFNNTTDWNRSSGVTWDETSPHTVIYTHTDVTYDNNIVVSRAMTSFVTQPRTLCIGMLRDGNPRGSTSFLKYIEFKLYESTTQTRNYVAAKRLSDNKYGMYDTLNDTFLSSAGSNEYTGTSKSTPQYIY